MPRQIAYLTVLFTVFGCYLAYYSNAEAFECYAKVEEKCTEDFHGCVSNADCIKELKTYEKCEIPNNE